MNVSVVIPTFQAEGGLPLLLQKLREQITLPFEIIVVDSSSSDKTVEIAREYQCVVSIISKNQFRHGTTRNYAAGLAKGEILVFLTQDVLPANQHFLAELSRPIHEDRVAASTARQIPYSHANPIEKLTRQFNYPEQSNCRTWQDVQHMGIKALFFSNSASAINKNTFWELGGFSENVIVNEDLEFCARLLNAGYSAAYTAHAVVYHSLPGGKRQKSTSSGSWSGFFNQAEELLKDVPLQQEGWRYLSQLSKELFSDNKQLWIPRLVMEASIKFSAYHLGLRYQVMPNRLKRKLSGQSYYW